MCGVRSCQLACHHGPAKKPLFLVNWHTQSPQTSSQLIDQRTAPMEPTNPFSLQWVSSTHHSPEELRRRKYIKKGIDFTLLICGQEGTGKVSFVNTLCNQTVLERDTSNIRPEYAHTNPGIDMVKLHVNIAEEDSTPISLDIIMFPGFGDNVENSLCTSRVVEFLESGFQNVYDSEVQLHRDPKMKDGRPHAALYFIKPTSKGLRELDLKALKELSTRVNVIPLLSKADSLTYEELKINKELIMADIKANRIPIYNFASSTESDRDTQTETRWLCSHLPFAIAGSYETDVIDGQVRHVRDYPWGRMVVEDPEHSDFTMLRNALLGSHLDELKEHTHTVLYENFRAKKMSSNSDNKQRGPTFPAVAHNNTSRYIDEIHESSQTSGHIASKVSVSEEARTIEEIAEAKKKIEALMRDLEIKESFLRRGQSVVSN